MRRVARLDGRRRELTAGPAGSADRSRLGQRAEPGEAGHQHLQHLLRRPALAAPQAQVGVGEQHHRPGQAAWARAPCTRLSALRAGNVEPLRPSTAAACCLVGGARSVQAQHPLEVAVQRHHDLQRMAPTGTQHPVQLVQGGGRVAPVDGVGQLPGGHRAGVAQEGLDSSAGAERSSPGRRTRQRVSASRMPGRRAHVVAHLVGQEPAGGRLEAEPAGADLVVEPLLAGPAASARPRRPSRRPRPSSASPSALGTRAAPGRPDQHERGAVQRVGQVARAAGPAVDAEALAGPGPRPRGGSLSNGGVWAASTTAASS